MLYRLGQGEAHHLCVPDGGGGGRLLVRILQECHDTPLGGHLAGTRPSSIDSLTAADTAWIIREMVFRSGDGISDVLVVDHDSNFTSALFKEFTHSISSSLIIGSTYHKNTNAQAERVNRVLGDTLRASAKASRMTGTCGCPTQSSPSTSLPRRWEVT